MSNTIKKSIDEFTKEELFEFYNDIREREVYLSDGFNYCKPNESLLDDIDSMVKRMEQRK